VIDRLPFRLFGRHVRSRPDDGAGGREVRPHHGRRVTGRLTRGEFGYPEIEHLDLAVGRDQDVAGLEIAMGDPLGMRGGNSPGQRERDLDQVSQRQAAGGHARGNGVAVDELHHQQHALAGFVNRVDGDDVRMGQGGEQPRLTCEALALLRARHARRGQDLDRDPAPQRRVVPFVDFAHAAGPQQRTDVVRADT
jgi:hypothetical protein